MITFLPDITEGAWGTRVAVTSDTHGLNEFTVRDIEDNESVLDYLEFINNTYWNNVGKNKRRYYGGDSLV